MSWRCPGNSLNVSNLLMDEIERLVTYSASKIKIVERFSFEVAFSFWSWRTICRSEVSSGAGRPTEAMIWTREMNFSKSSAELKTSNTITEAKLRAHFEVLDSKIASNFEKIINRHFKRRVFLQQKIHRKRNAFSREGRSPWIIYEYFKVADADEAVLDFNESRFEERQFAVFQ